MAMISLILSDGKDTKHSFTRMAAIGEKELQFDAALRKPHPHYFFTPLPFHLLKNCFTRSRPKVICIMRNPFDQLVSFYHMYKMCEPYGQYTGSWDEFYEELYKEGKLFYGSYFDHVAGWWGARQDHKDHILYIKYEDMHKDLHGVLIQVASFLGKELAGDIIPGILAQLSFESMKKDPKVNHSDTPFFNQSLSPFLRKGMVGNWKDFFNEKQTEEIKKQYAERLVSLGLTFDIDG